MGRIRIGCRALVLGGFALALAACAEEKAVPMTPMGPAGLDAALERHAGRPMLLNLWAMWCKPCVAELPELEEVRQELSGDGIDVVGLCVEGIQAEVDMATARDRVPRFVARRELGLDIWFWTERSDAPIFKRLPLPRKRRHPGTIPITLAVDAQGEVVEFFEGGAKKAQFLALAKRLRAPSGSSSK